MNQKKKKRDTAKKLFSLPDDWEPKPSHFELAVQLHRWGRMDVVRQAERFRDTCISKDYHYKDFDLAFNNCIRDKWGHKNGQG